MQPASGDVGEIETKTNNAGKEIDKYFEQLQQQLQRQKAEIKKELLEAFEQNFPYKSSD